MNGSYTAAGSHRRRRQRHSPRHRGRVGMRDGVPANRAGATLKPNDLALKAIIARQDDANPVVGLVRNCKRESRPRSRRSDHRRLGKWLFVVGSISDNLLVQASKLGGVTNAVRPNAVLAMPTSGAEFQNRSAPTAEQVRQEAHDADRRHGKSPRKRDPADQRVKTMLAITRIGS